MGERDEVQQRASRTSGVPHRPVVTLPDLDRLDAYDDPLDAPEAPHLGEEEVPPEVPPRAVAPEPPQYVARVHVPLSEDVSPLDAPVAPHVTHVGATRDVPEVPGSGGAPDAEVAQEAPAPAPSADAEPEEAQQVDPAGTPGRWGLPALLAAIVAIGLVAWAVQPTDDPVPVPAAAGGVVPAVEVAPAIEEVAPPAAEAALPAEAAPEEAQDAPAGGAPAPEAASEAAPVDEVLDDPISGVPPSELGEDGPPAATPSPRPPAAATPAPAPEAPVPAPAEAPPAAEADPPATASAPSPGPVASVRFTSTPPRAEVYVDGMLAGATPITRDVPQGEHVVRMTLPGHEAVEQAQTFDEAEARVAFELPVAAATGVVSFDDPVWAGAVVFVDGAAKGRLPTTVTLTEGAHTFRVRDAADDVTFEAVVSFAAEGPTPVALPGRP